MLEKQLSCEIRREGQEEHSEQFVWCGGELGQQHFILYLYIMYPMVGMQCSWAKMTYRKSGSPTCSERLEPPQCARSWLPRSGLPGLNSPGTPVTTHRDKPLDLVTSADVSEVNHIITLTQWNNLRWARKCWQKWSRKYEHTFGILLHERAFSPPLLIDLLM